VTEGVVDDETSQCSRDTETGKQDSQENEESFDENVEKRKKKNV